VRTRSHSYQSSLALLVLSRTPCPGRGASLRHAFGEFSGRLSAVFYRRLSAVFYHGRTRSLFLPRRRLLVFTDRLASTGSNSLPDFDKELRSIVSSAGRVAALIDRSRRWPIRFHPSSKPKPFCGFTRCVRIPSRKESIKTRGVARCPSGIQVPR